MCWNLNGFGKQDRKLDWVLAQKPDLILLQEVKAALLEEMRSRPEFKWVSCSLDHSETIQPDRKGWGLGCAIATTRPDFSLIESGLLPDNSVPARCAWADVGIAGKTVTLVSFHAPPGVNWFEKKNLSYLALRDFLIDRRGSPTILGMDANSPCVDHPDLRESIFYRDGEREILGDSVKHDLRDAYRVYLENNPKAHEAVLKERPNGPIAISHFTGTKEKIPRRYDFLFSSKEFEVERMEYPLEQSLAAGSDHSAVLADLDLA